MSAPLTLPVPPNSSEQGPAGLTFSGTNPFYQKKPAWLKVPAPTSASYQETVRKVRTLKLNTVCEEAACPNIGECWSKKHATFIIMGDTCTRACAFCNIKTGKPVALDPFEPYRVAQAVKQLDLKHVVITSVDRDDLPDGGAEHFVETIGAIRKQNPSSTIEILTPDFLRKEGALARLLRQPPDVFNHNLETIPRLYRTVRPGARYFHSLSLLAEVKKINPALFTKSGIMVGLGESQEEVLQVMDDMRAAQIDFLTIGQYLQPTPSHYPVQAYVTPDIFDLYKKMAQGKGFLMVSSSPLTRSSYHADKDFAEMKSRREKILSLHNSKPPSP